MKAQNRYSKKIFSLILLFLGLNQANLFSQDLFSTPVNSKLQFNINLTGSEPVVPDVWKSVSGPESVPVIKIIESQSNGHNMDTIWRSVAQGMGYSASVVPQTFLDDTSFIPVTDVLIVSSGVIDIPSNRVDAIRRFIVRSRSVYLQSEYLPTFSANIAFANLVNQLGGAFSWTQTLNGDLQPVTVLGTLATTPNVVPPLSYFWYGAAGTGNETIEYYLQKNSDYIGFIFKPPNPSYGILITNSDQDWIRTSTSPALVQNILYKLVHTSVGIGISSNIIPDKFDLAQNYPNPFNPSTTINFSIPTSTQVTMKVFDALGKEVATLVDEFKSAGNYSVDFSNTSHLTSGVYFYSITAGDFVDTKKLMLLK